MISNMKDRGIPSGQYADIILEFALEYGGNDGSEIKFMHDVACHFGCSNVLGETFWTAVTKTVFADRTSMCPLLRVALCLCNLSAEQVQDGIGKLLVKSDVTKLASKAKEKTAQACEDALLRSKAIIAALSEQYQQFDETASLEPLGKLFVRVGLYGTDKGHAGRENKKYGLQQIKQLFLDELTNIVGKEVKYAPWSAEEKKWQLRHPAVRAIVLFLGLQPWGITASHCGLLKRQALILGSQSVKSWTEHSPLKGSLTLCLSVMIRM